MHAIMHGDCLDHLRTMPDSSVHAIVTDPPYGLTEHKPATILAAMTAWANGDREHVPDGKGFMGRAWDGFVPPPAVWDECLRVLKPGGHMLVFAGTRTVDLMGLSIRLAGFEIRDSIGVGSLMAWIQGQGFPKGKAQLKPAWEPIIVARKKGPLWLNIDACRVVTGDDMRRTRNTALGVMNDDGWQPKRQESDGHEAGRWPTNVVLTHGPDCSDTECQGGCPVAELDQQSEGTRAAKASSGGSRSRAGDGWGMGAMEMAQKFHDSGCASRFFPTFRYQAKAPTKERPKVNGIAHPTCKPLSLMKWLVRLVCPPDGTVIDPFAGSGTTVEAAIREGFDVIGIERELDYLPLIHHRVDRAVRSLASEPEQEPGLFDVA